MNPLVPGAGDIALALVVIVHASLAIAALVALILSRLRSGRILLAALAMLMPIVGPVLALIASRRPRVAAEQLRDSGAHSAA